jgi:hypothetical protein
MVGKRVSCPHCHQVFEAVPEAKEYKNQLAAERLRQEWDRAEQDQEQDQELAPPRHSELGITATALGGFGSLMLLIGLSLPPTEHPVRGAFWAIGLIVNVVGFCVAAVSFCQPNRLRSFSWLGLILSGWLLACLALMIFPLALIFGSGHSSHDGGQAGVPSYGGWVKGHLRKGRWVRSHYRRGRR